MEIDGMNGLGSIIYVADLLDRCYTPQIVRDLKGCSWIIYHVKITHFKGWE